MSPRLVSSGDGEGVSPVAMQKVPVAVDDATPSPTIKVANVTANSFGNSFGTLNPQ